MRDIVTARTRTHSDPTTFGTQSRWEGYGGDWTYYNVYSTYDPNVAPVKVQVRNYNKTTKDTSTLAYLDKVRAGAVFCKDYSMEASEFNAPVGTIDGIVPEPYANAGVHEHHYEMQLANFLNSSTYASLVIPEVDSYANRALSRAYAAANSSISEGLVTAAEMHKTMRMAKGILGNVVHLLQKGVSAKRLLARGAISASQAADAWLTVRYGLRPLYYDMKNVIESIQALGKPKRTRFASALRWEDAENVDGTTPFGALGQMSFNLVEFGSLDIRAGVFVEQKLTNESIKDVFGLRLHDLPTAGWELVPFSFVVDWFANTADVIAAVNPVVGYRLLADWIVVDRIYRRTTTLMGGLGLNYAGYARNWEASGVTESISEKETTRYANNGTDELQFEFNLNLSAFKIVDLVALLRAVDFSAWRI